MKRILSVIFSVIILSSLVAVAGASDEYIFDDHAYLQEKGILDETADEIAEKTGYTVSCCITDSAEGMNGNEQAQRIFEEKFGDSEGMILLDCVDTKKYYIYFSREINNSLSQTDAQTLFKAYDSENDYDSSVASYLTRAMELLLPISEKENQINEQSIEQIPENRSFDRVVDLAGVITKQDMEKLKNYADSISEQYKCDVAAVFTDSTAPKDAQAYADDFYDYNGYGYGENDDGILLLVAVGDRRYAITTYGYGIEAFSDSAINYLTDRFTGKLSSGNWADAALEFITGCGEVLYSKAYESENNAGTVNAEIDPLTLIPINIAAGLIIGFIAVGGMKSKHKSVKKKEGASDYLRSGSFKLTYSNDRFIRSSVNRVKRPEPQSRSTGGGSSTHISSSGRTHGGRSGGF